MHGRGAARTPPLRRLPHRGSGEASVVDHPCSRRSPVAMQLPEPRGPLTGALVDALRSGDPKALPAAPAASDDPIADDDQQLALWILFELHYRGFDDDV